MLFSGCRSVRLHYLLCCHSHFKARSYWCPSEHKETEQNTDGQHRSQWPRGLKCRSAVARLLGLWVRIPPEEWEFVCYECCMMSGRGLCDELITHPEESYRLWCVVVCDLETSRMRRPWPTGGCRAKNKQTKESWGINHYP